MVIDISQEVFNCHVFPGDPQPQRKVMMSMNNGSDYNLTDFSMCAHNGTHVDAPFHFINDGKKIDEVGLEMFVGDCYVYRHEGDVNRIDAELIMETARKAGASERILISGKAVVTEEAAKVFADSGVLLVGNESQTVGPESSPKNVHLILLGAGIVLLEGVVLEGVEDGKYFLNSAPLKLGGSDGAPCRAFLMK